jgi:hypothetical protein
MERVERRLAGSCDQRAVPRCAPIVAVTTPLHVKRKLENPETPEILSTSPVGLKRSRLRIKIEQGSYTLL